jgi:hypothetical protein
MRHRIYYSLYSDCLVLVAADRIHAHVEHKLGTNLTRSLIKRSADSSPVDNAPPAALHSSNSIYLDPVKTAEPQVHVIALKRCNAFRIPSGFGM